MTTSTGTIDALYRYPVKGMTPQPLEQVAVEAGGTLPFDRAYAIENGPGRFDPEHPKHLPKITFLMLMRDERLATLTAQFDDTSETLTILRAGKQVARGQLTMKLGRSMIEQFLAAYMKDSLRGAPRIVSAPGHSFSDVAAKCLHVVNLASLAELERMAGRSIDPLRFRANVYLSGFPAWEEFKWLGKELALGAVRAGVFHRTQRCDATNVDPASAHRDMAIPALLQRHLGHTDFGIYANVREGGTMAKGDAVSVG